MAAGWTLIFRFSGNKTNFYRKIASCFFLPMLLDFMKKPEIEKAFYFIKLNLFSSMHILGRIFSFFFPNKAIVYIDKNTI